MRLAVLLAGMLVSASAWANIGTVTELSGSATVKRGKETIAVVKGTVIEQNDRVETKNGKLKIVFKDDTQVSVTEHSNLVIDDFVYDPKSGKGSLGLKATGGTVRYVSGAIAKDPRQVKINTPTAAIAVRGTDFVMSVNEVGSSMVILMPTCDWETSSLKGAICGSGKIDVESGPNLVKLDRPYQATLVESAGQPPTPPITVNLFGTPIGNNLQITPPRTMSGGNVIAAARAAAAATGVTREAKKEDKDDKEGGAEERHAAADKKSTASRRIQVARANKASETQEAASGESAAAEEKTTTVAEAPETPTVTTDLAAEVVEKSIVSIAQSSAPAEDKTATAANSTTATSSSSESENPYVKKLWKDKSETRQVGWLYESLNPSSRNYVNIAMPVDTKAQVIVTQDGLTSSWNFSSGRPQGQIVINQTFR